MQNYIDQNKLTASDKKSFDYSDISISISGDGNAAIIGSSGDDSSRGSTYSFTRSGSTWTQQTKLTASDGQNDDYFGVSVSVSSDGSTAILGAYIDDDSRGSAYIFTRSGSAWTQQAKLVASDGVSPDNFGRSVSISSDGSAAIVGAPFDDSHTGSAYIFIRSGSAWTQQAKLVASDGADDDLFGYSVSISSDGNTAIVGAHCDDNARGSVYIFTRSRYGWHEQAKLIASDGTYGDFFGWSVSISVDGNTVIVGACYDVSSYLDQGSTYIFTKSGSTWSQQAKLVASDGADGGYFGCSVSISSDGNTAIVGANGDDAPYLNQGSAYIFTRSGSSWSQQAKLTASDGASGDWFGRSVSISADGNTAIVSAYYDDVARGSAYIFIRSGSAWTQQTKLTASDGLGGDCFGHSVSVSSDGSTAIVGAHGDDGYRGSAYTFIRSVSSCENSAS